MAIKANRKLRLLVPALALAGVCAPDTGIAQQITGRELYAQLYGAVERSTNVTQRRGAGVDSTMTSLGFAARLARDGRRLDYGLNGDIAWTDYSSPVYGGSSSGGLDGFLNWGADDDFLHWTVRDTVRQSRLDPFANDTPDNLETVNVFSTGPTLNIRMGSRTALEAKGLYSRITMAESPLDANRLEMAAALTRQLGGGARLGLNASLSNAEYVDRSLGFADFDVREYYLRYDSGERRRFSLLADVGISEAETGDDSNRKELLRLTLSRRLTEMSDLYFGASQYYSAAAQHGLERLVGVETEVPVSSLGAMRFRSVDASWQVRGQRTLFSLSGTWGTSRYASQQGFDNSWTRVRAFVSRQLRSTLSASLSVSAGSESVREPGVPYSDFRDVDLELNRRWGRRLGTSLHVTWSERDSSGGGSQFDFSEWRYGLRLNYLLSRPGG